MKETIQKLFQRDNLITLVLAGILLFVISLPVKDTNGTEEAKDAVGFSGNLFQTKESSESALMAKQSNLSANTSEATGSDYAEYLENRLKKVLHGMEGVGEVEVMITLEASEELVVEKDEPLTRSNTNEEDAEGGKRIITELNTNETTIYRTEGNNSEPYVVKTILPKVEGVVVVAQGAGSGTVNKSITEVVQALFDVEAHKVKVVKGK